MASQSAHLQSAAKISIYLSVGDVFASYKSRQEKERFEAAIANPTSIRVFDAITCSDPSTN